MKCEDCKYADKSRYKGNVNSVITYCNCKNSVFYQMTVPKNMACGYYDGIRTFPFDEVVV